MLTVAPFRSACFFSVNNGATVQRRISAAEEEMNALPANVTNLFRFDETQVNNKGLLAQWAANSAAFTMAGSQVLVDEQPAEFDPPTLMFEALESAEALWAKLNTNDALTQEEQARLGALNFRANKLLRVGSTVVQP